MHNIVGRVLERQKEAHDALMRFILTLCTQLRMQHEKVFLPKNAPDTTNPIYYHPVDTTVYKMASLGSTRIASVIEC